MGDKFHWTAKIAIKLKTFVRGQSVTCSTKINRIWHWRCSYPNRSKSKLQTNIYILPV